MQRFNQLASAVTLLSNTTRNQHFLPRTEQKLTALNPSSVSGKFRIYSFHLQNRNTLAIELENPRGRPIDSTLSIPVLQGPLFYG